MQNTDYAIMVGRASKAASILADRDDIPEDSASLFEEMAEAFDDEATRTFEFWADEVHAPALVCMDKKQLAELVRQVISAYFWEYSLPVI